MQRIKECNLPRARYIRRRFRYLYKFAGKQIIINRIIMEAELMETESGPDSSKNSQAPILEIGDQPSPEFLELFTKFDSTIGGELIEKAWKQYDTIGQQIVLEGNQNVWMACAFFTSVWKATPFGRQELICRFSLSKLLELCQVGVLDFFDKLNKWVDLIVASRRLLDHVHRVQSNLAVSAVIFKKYLPIFRHVFINVKTTKASTNQKQITKTPHTRQHTKSPQKRQLQEQESKLTTVDLFEFCWIVFIALKKQHHQEDLLSSFHLLLCVLDYIFVALEQAGMHEHINPSLAENFLLNEQTSLEYLCREFDGIILDAKHLRTHWFLPTLNQLSNDGVIVGHYLNNKDGAGILRNFEENRQAFMDLYEQRMLVRSEIDEQIFLKPTILANIGMVFSDKLNEIAVMVLREFGGNNDTQPKLTDTDLLIKISTQNCLEKLSVGKQMESAPITGKSYVITPETICPNSVITAEVKQSERLELLLANYRNSDDANIFDECQENPRDFVAQQLLSFTQKLMSKFDEEMLVNGPDYDEEFEKNMSNRISNMESLFYLLLQKVITYDRERTISMGIEMTIDLGAIFQSIEFLASVFICASDLILWTYGSKRTFPWSAELFKSSVAPLHFYRIIELVVRADTGLSREAVKHLNQMEESVLEELAWQPDSPIWNCLENSQAMAQFNEVSAVPSSQILARNYAHAHRHADLGQAVNAFFKKVYHLAVIRVTDLCERVRIMEDLNRQKIWTLFEHIFRMQTKMLKGRHLDQLLMCSVYIIAKVCHLGTTFQDIIYHYRHQPQSVGRVYRHVLMNSIGDLINSAAADKPGPSTSKLMSESELQQQDEYADLIKFYNQIFVSHVEDFVKLLHPSGPDSKENLVPLNAMPRVPLNPLSPRKLISDRINVVPMSQYIQNTGTGRTIRRYDFHKSPSKDLKNINAMVGGTTTTATMHGAGSHLGGPPPPQMQHRYGYRHQSSGNHHYYYQRPHAPPNNAY